MERLMRLLLVLVVLACTPKMLTGQEVAKPIDIPTLEILIDWHKQKYNKLSDRALKEAAKMTVAKTTTDLSEQYHKLHKELTSRYTNYLAWGSLAIDALSLATEVKDSFGLISTFAENIKHITNIYVVREYLSAIEGIKGECTYLSACIKKIPLLQADAQEIHSLLVEIKGRISAIKHYMYSCNFMVQGYVALQGQKYFSDPIDKAKIAAKIIKEYSK